MAKRKQKSIANITGRNEVIQNAVNKYFEAKNKEATEKKQLSVIHSVMGSVGEHWSKNGENRIYFNDFNVFYNKDNGEFYEINKHDAADLNGLYQALAERLVYEEGL